MSVNHKTEHRRHSHDTGVRVVIIRSRGRARGGHPSASLAHNSPAGQGAILFMGGGAQP
jgi:hypothetical protein